MSTTTTELRPTLGNFMSAVCFRFLREGTEDVTGRVPLVNAGRERGRYVAEELGWLGQSLTPEQMTVSLHEALGLNGTRLCLVDSVTAKPNGGYEVRIHEGACAAGVRATEPHCAYTLGVFVGAISAITGRLMFGREAECEAVNQQYCVYQIDPI